MTLCYYTTSSHVDALALAKGQANVLNYLCFLMRQCPLLPKIMQRR